MFFSKKKSRSEQRISKYFLDEEVQMQKWQAYVKLLFIVVFCIEPSLFPDNPDDWLGRTWDVGVPLSFLPVCLMQMLIARTNTYHPFMKYVFTTIDIALFAFFVIIPSPFNYYPTENAEMLQIIGWYREQDMAEGYIFFVVAFLTHSRKFSIYFGFLLAAAWIAHMIAALMQDVAFTDDSIPLELVLLPQSIWELDPRYVDQDIAGHHAAISILMGLGLALVASRTRQVFQRLFVSERRRASLTRYFSPNVLDRVMNSDSGGDELLGAQTNAAILFADIRGFTQIADKLEAKELLELLQTFHGKMEAVVFSHEGTLEKYIGDAVMATFGAPDASDVDAKSAFDCAVEMQDVINDWSNERVVLGRAPIEIGIGISYGNTVSGVIGQDRNKSFVVTGAVVTEASRLQSITRQLESDIVVSSDFYERLKAVEGAHWVDQFREVPQVELKGFSSRSNVWARTKA